MELERKVWTLEYYKDEELKSLSFSLKILTPALRTEIINYDTNYQISNNKFTKEIEGRVVKHKDKKAFKKQEEEITNFVINNPNATAEQIQTQAEAYALAVLGDMSEEELMEANKTTQKIHEHNDKSIIDFFKLIVDLKTVPSEERKYFAKESTPETEAFWMQVDIQKVMEINKFFRSNSSI